MVSHIAYLADGSSSTILTLLGLGYLDYSIGKMRRNHVAMNSNDHTE